MNRPLRRYLVVALFLALALGGTYVLEARAVRQLRAHPEAAQEAAVARAVAHVEREVTALQEDLLGRAEVLAAAEPVQRALREGPAAWGEAVRYVSAVRLPEGVTAEVYTPRPELVAWQGPSLPFGAATHATRFLSTVQTSVAEDGDVRRALVVWLPVRDGREVLGAIRMLRLVESRVPVRNQYLRDLDLTEVWQEGAHIPSRVILAGRPFRVPEAAVVHPISGLDGTVLARMIVPPPSVALLEALLRVRYGDIAAFWGVLLLGWLVAGLIGVQRRMGERVVRERDGPPWAIAGAVALALGVAWWGLRYALLGLGVPSRWLSGSPFFDPALLASSLGGGLIGSVGDLALTALFAVGFGVGWLRFALVVLRSVRMQERVRGATRPPGRAWPAFAVLAAVAGTAAIGFHALLLRRATIDTTLPYFDRTGPLPAGMVMLVFGVFLLLTLATLLVLVGLGVLVRVKGLPRALGGALAVAAVLAVAYLVTPISQVVPWPVAVVYFGVAAFAAWWLEREPDRWSWPLTLRGTLLTTLVLAMLTYPVLFDATADEARVRLVDAAEDFADGEDTRVAFALEQVLLDARASDAVHEAMRAPRADGLDSLATDLVTGSLLAALADYTVGLALLAPGGDTLGVYQEQAPPGADPALFGTFALAPGDPFSFRNLRRQYADAAALGFLVVREPARSGRGKHRYAGLGPIRSGRASGAAGVLGWVVARAEPKPARYVSETPFPRVLVPAGLSDVVDTERAFGEFRDGVLVRTRGGDFGRFRLPEAAEALAVGEALWREETVGEQRVRAYYCRLAPDRVVAIRVPDVAFYDHLYFFLRLVLPGLLLAGLAYAAGRPLRREAGVLPTRVRLRDRVLNRFLLVGIASVAVTGLIGQAVIVEQNQQAIEDRLKRRLARVEADLYEVANPEGEQGDLPLYRLLDRARPDLVGPRLGLDINLYRGYELIASSRSQLVRQRLLDRRLPAAVYEALFVEGERYAFAEEQIGSFTYTTGYEVLPDDAGRPGAVLAIPTLPEQLAIEADQARMIAYLFGVLLLLLIGIFLITTLLANRLTRPFRHLRQGLLAVGAGEDVAEPIPVESQDEIGELIETFNAIRHQLEESRRKLATQERELAWREMARQVAHEIKNPLTPMKLSVQHLRRAYDQAGDADGRFGPLFRDKTETLIEQIDALTRIANEFSNFARLPQRHLQEVDLNAVIREAAALVGEEERVRFVLDLGEEDLPVRADREELRRVYINLLKNAIQAIPEDERGTVTLRSERRSGTHGPQGAPEWAWSAVRDTGTGIPEEVREKVFQPNFSTKTSGMGLGLAIVRKAVEEHGGDIRFETEEGVGTTFFVRLPLAGARGAGEASGAKAEESA